MRVRFLLPALLLFGSIATAHPGETLDGDCPNETGDVPAVIGDVGAIAAAGLAESAAMLAACANNALYQATQPGAATASRAADERLGARFTGPWTAAEKDLLARVLDTLPPSLVERMRVGELRRAKDATVGGRAIPNPAVFTPNGGGLLQVADRAFDRQPERAMVILLHELLHSTQLTSTGRPHRPTSDFFRDLTGWRYDIVSTGIFSREYRWTHEGRRIYIGPNYGEGLFPPDNGLEEMVAAMVDYVAAPDVLKSEQPAMYERLRTAFFGGREYRCGG